MRITSTQAGVGTVASVFIVGVVMVVASACGSSTSKANQPYLDSGNKASDNTAAITIVDPDGFSNMSAKCVGRDGVYAAYHNDNAYAAIQVVPNDPNCTTGTYVDPNAR